MGFTTTIQRKVGPGNPLKRPVDKGTAPNQSLMATDEGSDFPEGTGDPRFDAHAYEPGGSPQLLAADLSDVGRGYMVVPYTFGVFVGASGSGSSKGVLSQVIQQDGASDNGRSYDNPPAPTGRRIEMIYMDPDDNMGLMSGRIQIGLPTTAANQEEADFGTFIGNENANDMELQGGSLLIVPITDELEQLSLANPTIDDHGGGGIFGNWFTDVYSTGQTPNPLVGSQVTDDLDIVGTMLDNLIIHESRRNERWIVFWYTDVEKRGSFPTADSRVARWNFEFEGEDLFNVRTNTTTGGSTKNGRGYSWSIPINNFCRMYACQFRVMDNLPVGRPLTGSTRFNIWDASRNTGSPTELDLSNPVIWRTEQFSAFEFSESRVAVVTNSDSWADSAFELTIESDGTTPMYLAFSTSLHQFEGQTRFRITRDGTPISPDGTDYVTWGQSDQLTHIGGSNGSGDTDNDTIPFHFMWFDTPPAGARTYRIQYRRNSGFTGSNNAMWNCRDDGSDGFIGTFFAAEMAFPTRQPY